MGIKIGHAACDENGKYSCGKAGDQTGKEVCTRDWYNRPWNVILVHPDATIREKLAKAMDQACANDNIGYDQDSKTSNDAGRYSLFTEARKVQFQLAKIKTKCETDCSALVAVCCNAAGLAVSEYIYTGNERKALEDQGFKAYTDKKYLTSPDYLPRGAVLLYEGHHTAIQLQNGCKYCATEKPAIPATVKVSGTLVVNGTSSLAVRDYPSTDNSISKVKSTLAKNASVKVIAKTNIDGIWWFNTDKDLWVSGRYLNGVLTEADGRSWIVETGYTYSTNTLKIYCNKQYWLDQEGWIVTPDRLNKDGSLK